MAAEEGADWLVRLYEAQGATLHRLAVLLGAEEQSGRIVRGALLALHRRSHRIIDPAERIEFLQEKVVHAARAVRHPNQALTLPVAEDPRQQELLTALTALPARMTELVVVSHYLSVFGPELAAVMRMSLRGCNQKLEIARETLRVRLDETEARPAGLEALSQEVTAALRAAARSIQPPGTDTLSSELAQVGDPGRVLFGARSVVVLTVLALLAGLILAVVTNPAVAPAEPGTASPEPVVKPSASRSIPAQARSVPIYYVGRRDAALFRELRDLTSSGDLVRSAVEALFTVPPADPDYESKWNAGRVVDVTVGADSVTVDLSADAYADIGDDHAAHLARSQIIYTVSDLVADPNLSVHFLADGAATPEAFANQEGYTRDGLAPMPPVWITSPKNLAKLGAGPITITGTIKPDNGEPVVRILDTDSGAVVVEEVAQTATGTNQDGWRLWSFSVDLKAGRYEVSATTRKPQPAVETKTFEVG